MTKSGHATADILRAHEHLIKDPGLPFAWPMPSLWQQPPTRGVSDHQSSTLPKSSDIVIIGSGITGCSVAKHLLEKDAKVKVTLLEARTITSGATGRNGGHIIVVPELFYAGFKAVYGKEVAEQIVHFSNDNQDTLLKMIDTLSPSLVEHSELRQLEVLHIFRTEGAKSNAERLVSMLNAELPTLKYRSIIVSKVELLEKYGVENALGGVALLAGAVNPYRLVTGILACLLDQHGNRFSIEALTPAESIKWNVDSREYQISTPRGTIAAKQVIHATNAWSGHLLPSLRSFVYPLRCQVSVQENATNETNHVVNNTWCITTPGALISIYQSPQTGDFYVSGLVGVSNFFEEVTSSEDDNDLSIVSSLSKVMNDIYGKPVQGQVKANWTGIMGYTADGVPLVGQLSHELSGRDGSCEWIAAGFNGIGMVNAWLCGEHIADSVLGKSQPRRIPSIYVATKERIDRSKVEHILNRSYAVWE